ncbi:MAG TPA: hypothetical protein VFV38_07380 [Ktedonobacteraceae bacterium]|nr:hypothetical protein [Ktedonobacteraceae bacterium]
MMPRFYKFVQSSLVEKIFLGILSLVYLVYMVGFVHTLSTPSSSSPIIVEHQVGANPVAELQHWSVENMRAAIDDQEVSDTFDFTQQGSSDIAKGQAAQQDGQVPSDTNLSYPLSTVGKVFFTNGGQDYVCSGTAIVSSNHNTIDTAGHCLYGHGNWVQNLIFCPLYDNGKTPYGCWVARALEVPADWIRGELSALHRDFGMAIVSTSSSQGNLTDVVGGAGWAYNQSAKQPFYAYGYPAGYPFDGQTRRSCEGSTGKAWPHAGGTVVSIPCDMTGGSSGGPWFIKVNGSWYLNGHNDFTSNLQRGHMFSPYYDDVWYALYNKAQRS